MKRRAFLQQAGSCACALALPSLPKAEAAPHDDAARVKTKAGTVRGAFRAGGVRAFRGIPFAIPPVGPLRFLPPRPMPSWKGVRETVEFAKMPVQPGHDEKDSSEDCLYLNVWTPPTANDKSEGANRPPYPVFVWIHGGGNNSGWSGGGLYDHAAFALSGVVTVTLSYRVGALGFLELGVLGNDYAGSANNGLRDLALGLRWVKDNIAAFGGDPNRITLGGESAGAKNVAALLASPEAGPLIARAVMESGSGQTVHTRETARDVTRHFLTALGLSDAPPDAIKARLLEATPADLLKAQAEATTKFGRAFPFRPLIDTPFLPKRPVDAIASGAAKDKALLIGTNRDESLLFFARRDAEKPITARELSHLTVPQIHEQRLRYEKTFLGLSPLDMRVRLLTSEEYWIPTVRVADAHAQKGKTYLYRFDQAETKGEREGYAPHASEVGYVWNNLSADAPKENIDLARRMHQAWVSFITAGVPTAPGLPDWPRYAPEGGRKTLLFGASGDSVQSDPRETERKLWDGVL